jgi:hypothetical protein
MKMKTEFIAAKSRENGQGHTLHYFDNEKEMVEFIMSFPEGVSWGQVDIDDEAAREYYSGMRYRIPGSKTTDFTGTIDELIEMATALTK